MKWLSQEKNRAYIYRVLASIGGLLAVYGLVDSNELATWLGAAGVLLNILPIANTSTKGE